MNSVDSYNTESGFKQKPIRNGGRKMNKPIKKYRSGQLEAAVWENDREVNGNIVSFKTVSLRKSWHDKEKDMWRDSTIQLRRNDIQKVIVIMQKVQEELLLAHDENEGDDEDE